MRKALLLGVLAVPLVAVIVLPGTYFPYVTGRAFVFRALIDLMLPVCALLLWLEGRKSLRWSPISTLFALLMGFMALADLLGVNAHRSFWGNFERMDGWVALAHLFALYLIMSVVMRTKAEWQLFWAATTAVSFFICAVGLAEKLLGTLPADSQQRLAVSLGNPAYLAMYLLQGIFITGLVAASCFGSIKPRWRAVFLAGAAVAAICQLAALMLTGTRAAAIGLVAGLLASVVCIAVQRIAASPGAWKRVVGASLAAVLCAAGASAAVLTFYPAFSRLSFQSIQNFQIQARLMNWKLALHGFTERPILGWGQENYRYVFERLYEPSYYDPELRLDRPHNLVLDWALAGGLPGLMLYLGLFAAAAVMLLRARKVSPAERAALLGFLSAYFTCNIFMFDNLATYVTFMAVLAYVQHLRFIDKGGDTSPASSPGAGWKKAVSLAAAAAVGIGLAWAINLSTFRSNLALAAALEADPQDKADRFAEALSRRSFALEDIRRQLARTAAQAMAAPAFSAGQRAALYSLAAAEMDKQIADDPGYSSPYLMAGVLRDSAGKYAEGLSYLLKAQQIAPRDQIILLYLGMNARSRGSQQEALDYFCQAYDLDRTIAALKQFCPRAE